jgi:hypothetical protein
VEDEEEEWEDVEIRRSFGELKVGAADKQGWKSKRERDGEPRKEEGI